jgi:hypothetical protein
LAAFTINMAESNFRHTHAETYISLGTLHLGTSLSDFSPASTLTMLRLPAKAAH